MKKLSKQNLEILKGLGVPDNLGVERQMGILELVKYADKGSVKRVKKGKVVFYEAQFDDGVYKGAFQFSMSQYQISPVAVLLECYQLTNWPGFKRRLSALNDYLFDHL